MLSRLGREINGKSRGWASMGCILAAACVTMNCGSSDKPAGHDGSVDVPRTAEDGSLDSPMDSAVERPMQEIGVEAVPDTSMDISMTDTIAAPGDGSADTSDSSPADASNGDSAETSVPATIHEQEGPFSGTWTWNGNSYSGVWDNGAVAVLTVQTFTMTLLMINRTDTAGSSSAGLTAVYSGTISSPADGGTGGRIVNGSVTWTWPGHFSPTAGTWTASWQ